MPAQPAQRILSAPMNALIRAMRTGDIVMMSEVVEAEVRLMPLMKKTW